MKAGRGGAGRVKCSLACRGSCSLYGPAKPASLQRTTNKDLENNPPRVTASPAAFGPNAVPGFPKVCMRRLSAAVLANNAAEHRRISAAAFTGCDEAQTVAGSLHPQMREPDL
jgi:hypothetical protein